jgi:hypothetical protein
MVSGRMRLSVSSNGISLPFRGVWQTLPAGDFLVYVDAEWPIFASWADGAGIMLAYTTDGLNVSKGYYFGFEDNFGEYIVVRDTSGGTTAVAYVGASPFVARFEISRVGNLLTFRYSLDTGGSWSTLATVADQNTFFTTGLPNRIGCHAAATVPNLGTETAYFDNFTQV